MFSGMKRKLAAIAMAVGLVGAPVATLAVAQPAGALTLACQVYWTSNQSIYGWTWTDYQWQGCVLVSMRTLYTSDTLHGCNWTVQNSGDSGPSWHPAPPGSGAFYSTPACFGNWYGFQVEAYYPGGNTWQCYTYHIYPYAQWVQNSQCTYL